MKRSEQPAPRAQPVSPELERLLARLGDPLPVQAGSNPNGAYLLVESRRDGRHVRVLVEASCGQAQVAEAVTACLAILARGRG